MFQDVALRFTALRPGTACSDAIVSLMLFIGSREIFSFFLDF